MLKQINKVIKANKLILLHIFNRTFAFVSPSGQILTHPQPTTSPLFLDCHYKTYVVAHTLLRSIKTKTEIVNYYSVIQCYVTVLVFSATSDFASQFQVFIVELALCSSLNTSLNSFSFKAAYRSFCF